MSGNNYKQLESETEGGIPLETKPGVPPPAYSQSQQPVAYSQQAGVSTIVVAPQVVSYPQPTGPEPKDYLVMSILTTFCCFWPLGIVAIIKSVEVRNAVQRGDYASAHASSRSALQFNKIAIVIGVIITVVTVVIVLVSQLSWIIPIAIYT